MITGVDIVKEQLLVASGYGRHSAKMILNLKDMPLNVALMLRIPTISCRVLVLCHYHPPGGNGVRIDSHIYSGYTVPHFMTH